MTGHNSAVIDEVAALNDEYRRSIELLTGMYDSFEDVHDMIRPMIRIMNEPLRIDPKTMQPIPKSHILHGLCRKRHAEITGTMSMLSRGALAEAKEVADATAAAEVELVRTTNRILQRRHDNSYLKGELESEIGLTAQKRDALRATAGELEDASTVSMSLRERLSASQNRAHEQSHENEESDKLFEDHNREIGKLESEKNALMREIREQDEILHSLLEQMTSERDLCCMMNKIAEKLSLSIQ